MLSVILFFSDCHFPLFVAHEYFLFFEGVFKPASFNFSLMKDNLVEDFPSHLNNVHKLLFLMLERCLVSGKW